MTEESMIGAQFRLLKATRNLLSARFYNAWASAHVNNLPDQNIISYLEEKKMGELYHSTIIAA